LSIWTMCAIVAKEFKLMPWDVRKLTFHQLNYILFHETDKHGVLVPIYDRKSDWQSDEERLREQWTGAGLSPEQCDLKWREFVEEDGERERIANLPPEEIEKWLVEFREKQVARRGPAW